VRLPSALLITSLTAVALPASAQEPAAACVGDSVLNVYRYVLDVEPPESPVLAVLEATTSHTRSATAPKPLALSLATVSRGGGDARPAAALDFSPYHLAGGGARSTCGYRDNSLAGRLKRVGTKTILSVGVQPQRGTGDLLRVGMAVRATLHDPHDPINNSLLVQRVPPAGAREEPPPASADSAYAAAAVSMRARDRWIVSAGWGAAATVSGASLGVREGEWRHALWLSWQRTMDARFDLVFTGEAGLERGTPPGYRLVAAARRKQSHADLLLEAAFDTRDERLHGGVSAEARVARRLRAALGVLSEPAAGAGRALRAAALLRWSAGY